MRWWTNLRRRRADQARRDWHGTYLSEDEIVADMLAKIEADPVAVRRWISPESWHVPILSGASDQSSIHAGCLMFAGMSVRNYYGLWHPDNPHTKCNGADLVIEDGIITDPRFPDNVSGRIMDRVRATLEARHGRTP